VGYAAEVSRAPSVALTMGLGLGLAACSLLSDLGGLASEDPLPDASADARGATSDASAEAARPEAGATEGGAPSANLHPQGSFGTGCGDWGSFQGSLEASALGHDAPGACRVCTGQAGVTSFFTIDDGGLGGAPVAGATYRATAWVRSPDGVGRITPSYATINLRTFERTPAFTTLEQQNQTEATPFQGTSWVQLAIELTVTQARGRLNVFIGAPGAANACFLVDDVRLERVN
jgi:hypothetical protein